MNRSFSKIRHIQKTNDEIEKRFLRESVEDLDIEDEFETNPEEENIDLEFDPEEIQDFGFDYEEEDDENRKYKEFLRKKFRPSPIKYPTKRWDKKDAVYKPYSPIKSTDMDLDTYLRSIKGK